MKKTALLVISFFFSYIVTSQITKGNWLVGGSGTYSNDRQKTSSADIIKFSQLSIAPNIGVFIFDKLASGLHLGAYYTKNVASTTTKVNTYSFGPFVRYYFLAKENIINFLAEGNYSFATSRFDNIGQINTSSYYIYSFLAGPVIFLNSTVGLELNVGYYHLGTKNSSTTNTIKVGIGFQIHLEK